MVRAGPVLMVAMTLLLAIACTTPPSSGEAPAAFPSIAPPPSPTPTAGPAGVSSSGHAARQVYTAFRTVPSPCCPPRPLPEILDGLRGFPGILDLRLEEGRIVVDYDPRVLSAEDLPVLFALHGLEVRP